MIRPRSSAYRYPWTRTSLERDTARRPPAPLLALTALAILGSAASTAGAQFGQPTRMVGIQPTALAQPSPVSVTIHWCDKQYPFSASTRRIVFKGQDVTSQFTYSYQGFGVYGCANYYGGTAVYSAVSTGTVTLTDDQTVDTLNASIYNTNGTLLSGTRVWQLQNFQVAVTPHGGLAAPIANQTGRTQAFQVRNYGNAATTYSIAVTCSGPAVPGCSAPSSVLVSPGAANQQTVNVTYTSGAADTKGTIELRATSAAYSDLGTVNVTAISLGQPTTRVLASEINPGTSIDRASCLVFAIVRNVASECGALRITHPLPSIRTLNKVRTPTLVYYSDQLDTTSLAVHVILADTATIPDYVDVYLWDVTTGSPVSLAPARTYGGAAWATNRAQRLTVSRIATGSTRIVKYQVEVALRYGAQSSPSIVANGELAIVNRANSRFGAGWWLAGVERLFPNQWDGSVLWVAGDGSTRKYVRSGTVGTDTAYLAEAVRRPDTLFRSAQGVFRRSLPNGTRVYFNVQGLDSATVNMLGHTTRLVWGAVGGEPRLDSLVVPSGSSRRAYAFQYESGGAGQLQAILAPGDPVTQPRQVTLTRNPFGTGVTRIAGPDANAVSFEFQSSAPDRLYLARKDRRLTRTEFGFEASSPATLAWASTPTGTGDVATDSLRTVIGIGAPSDAGPVPVDSIYFRFRGPRTDSVEVMKFWLDRFGAPTRIVNAVGDTTKIRRDDWRFPGRVTRAEYPVLSDGQTQRQRVQTATFDSRGNVKTIAELRPYYPSDSLDAVTRFEYGNLYWPTFVTRIVPPERDSIVIEYNSDGTRYTQRDARGDSTRVFFHYGNSWKLLSSAYQTGIRLDSMTYSSTLGNLAQSLTGAAYVTTIAQDSLGRDTLVTTPVDSQQTRFRRQRTRFSVMDRVDSAITVGDAFGRIGQQSLLVANAFDEEGNLKSVERWSSPDIPSNPPHSNPIGHIVTRWDYDNFHRRIREYAPDATPNDLTDNPFDEWRYDPAGNADTVITRGLIAGKRDTLVRTYDRLHRLNTRTIPSVRYSSRTGIMQNPPSGYTANLANMDTALNRTHWYPRFPNDPAGNPDGYTTFADTLRFWYDKLGNLVRADNHDAWVRRGYYLNGLIRGDTLKIRTMNELANGGDSTTHVYALGYSYDLNGRPLVLTHPGQLAPSATQNTTRYAYNAGGLLSSITDALGYTYGYRYDARGQLIKWILGSRPYFAASYTYDAEGNLTSDNIVDLITPVSHRSSTFTYWPGGKLAIAKNSQATKDTTWAWYAGLGHFGDGALTEVEYAEGQAGVESRAFNADAFGNVYEQYTNTYYVQPGGSPTGTSNYYKEGRLYQGGTGRLTAIQPYPQGQAVTDHSHATTYDPSGNSSFEMTLITNTQAPAAIRDRAYYYGADGLLRAVDSRSSFNQGGAFRSAFEEYRYDALGRRVLVHAQRYCWGATPWPQVCNLDWVRRTVWAGDAEIYEIQMPIDVALRENDVTGLSLPKQYYATSGTTLDPNPFYGRVAYTHGQSVDRPQSVIRLGYVSKVDVSAVERDTVQFAPFSITPLWDMRGQQPIGMYADLGLTDDGMGRRCRTKNGFNHCVLIAWPGNFLAYERPSFEPLYWHGTIHEDKKDATGLFYRRNRYYDGATGRFTQEDPIGLAGGVNLYGYANGDPVNFSDPFGLQACDPPGSCRAWGMTIGTALGGLAGMAVAGACTATSGVCALGAPTIVGFFASGGAALGGLIGEVLEQSGNSGADAPGQTAGGRATDEYGNVLGPSGKPAVHEADHPTKKRAKDAARQEGKGKPVNHPTPAKGKPHYHPTGPDGEKLPGSTHHNYPPE